MTPASSTRTSKRWRWVVPAPSSANPASVLGWLGLLVLVLLGAALSPAHAGSQSYTLGASGERRDHFPAIRAHATESVEGGEGSLRIRVRHPPGKSEVAAEALGLLRRMGRFLGHETGLVPDGKVEVYLFSLPPGREAVSYRARGSADFTEVLFLEEGRALLEVRHNRRRILTLLPHELSHLILHDLPLKDRWLEDGLAEYLRQRFAEEAVARGWVPPESNAVAYIYSDNWIPALAALDRMTLEPWSDKTSSRVLKKQKKNPGYALYLARQEWWRYAAARALTTRWMEAAAAAGAQYPLRDLVESIRERPGKIDWDATAELIKEQTGRAREELANVTDEELERARDKAWRRRVDPLYSVRLHALRMLTFIGLPPAAPAAELVPAFEMPEDVANPKALEWNLKVAAAGAVAAGDDPEAARKVAEMLESRHGKEAYFFAPPEFWHLLARKQRQRSLRALVQLVQDPRAGLAAQEQANLALKELTGEDVGWSPEARPQKRGDLAAGWERIVRNKAAPEKTAMDDPA